MHIVNISLLMTYFWGPLIFTALWRLWVCYSRCLSPLYAPGQKLSSQGDCGKYTFGPSCVSCEKWGLVISGRAFPPQTVGNSQSRGLGAGWKPQSHLINTPWFTAMNKAQAHPGNCIESVLDNRGNRTKGVGWRLVWIAGHGCHLLVHGDVWHPAEDVALKGCWSMLQTAPKACLSTTPRTCPLKSRTLTSFPQLHTALLQVSTRCPWSLQ